MKRLKENPLITKDMIKPSYPFLQVDGVFNAGASIYDNKIILLLRVAESYIQKDENKLTVPFIDQKRKKIMPITFAKDDARFDFSDSRVVKEGKQTVSLTSLSHFRRAYSLDGINFTIDEKPWIIGDDITEAWGIEDPRITKIDNTYYISYTAVSSLGILTNLIKTADFSSFERLGTIFVADNKDVAIFPEKINGKYYAYHRPVPTDIGTPNIWLASSFDLKHWGEHKVVLTVSDEGSKKGKLGAGAPAIKTEYGWLMIYHFADHNQHYLLKAFMADLNNPVKIIAKTEKSLLKPDKVYEKEGFFGNVVFTNGIIEKEEYFIIYYGAADDKIAGATIKKKELYQRMGLLNEK